MGLAIIQTGKVSAVQKSDAQSSASLKADSTSSTSSESSSSKKQSTSSKSETSQSSSTSSKSSSKVSSESNKLSNLPSIAKIKQKTDQMTSGKTANSSLLKAEAINDGVDWNPVAVPQTTRLEVPLDKSGQTILYTFGNGDGSLQYQSTLYPEEVDPPTITGKMPPKLNVFIKDVDGKLYPATKYGLDMGTSSSYDFGMTLDGSILFLSLHEYSIPYLMDKEYQIFEGTTKLGKPALKAVGTSTVQGVKLVVQLELVPDDEKPVLHEEMYIKAADTNTSAGVFYAQEPGISGYNANVFTLGKGHGLYLTGDSDLKAIISTNVKDGPFAFADAIVQQGRITDLATANYAISNYQNGRGWEAGGQEWRQEPNFDITNTKSAYSAKFKWRTIDPDHYEHYRVDFGLVDAGVVVPDASVEYTNDSQPDDGKNHVRDEVTITMEANNQGVKSSWDNLTLTAPVPKGLSIDDSSIKGLTDFATGSEAEVPVESSSYDAKTRMLTVKLPKDLADGQWEAVRYKASFNSYASGELNTQKMEVKGGDTIYNKATAEKDIPVEKFPNGLVKEVKNASQKETEYHEQTEVSPTETLDYKVDFWVNKDGDDISGISLDDNLGNGKLDYVKGSGKLEYSDGTKEDVPDSAIVNNQLKVTPRNMKTGEKVTLTYQAKVKADTPFPSEISNRVIFSGNTVNEPGIADYTSAKVKVVKPKAGDVIFRYIDRKTGEKIAKDVKVHGPSDKHVSEYEAADEWKMSELQADGTTWADSTQDANKIRPAHIADYTPIDYIVGDDLTASPEKVADVDPVIKSGEQIYTFRYEKTRLAITALPTKMNFGAFYDTQADRTFYLPAPTATPRSGNQKTPYGIEITDYWGISNWSLDVKQLHQFSGEYVPHDERTRIDSPSPKQVTLSGAQLQFSNAEFSTVHTKDNDTQGTDEVKSLDHFELNPNGIPKRLVTYTKKGHYMQKDGTNGTIAADGTDTLNTYDYPGSSVYKYQFGDEKSADYSIGLHVPSRTKRYTTNYSTTLLWNLTVAP